MKEKKKRAGEGGGEHSTLFTLTFRPDEIAWQVSQLPPQWEAQSIIGCPTNQPPAFFLLPLDSQLKKVNLTPITTSTPWRHSLNPDYPINYSPHSRFNAQVVQSPVPALKWNGQRSKCIMLQRSHILDLRGNMVFISKS